MKDKDIKEKIKVYPYMVDKRTAIKKREATCLVPVEKLEKAATDWRI